MRSWAAEMLLREKPHVLKQNPRLPPPGNSLISIGHGSRFYPHRRIESRCVCQFARTAWAMARLYNRTPKMAPDVFATRSVISESRTGMYTCRISIPRLAMADQNGGEGGLLDPS